MSVLRRLLPYFSGLTLLVASRLPQLAGDELVLDGDEAATGMMIRHMLRGESPQVFFYGQHYGLALIEVGVGAAYFFLFGVSTASLKVAMLSIWAVGWIFLVAAMRRWFGPRCAAVAGALLILCPAWGGWAMKARAGYVTAFAAAGACAWIIAHLEEPRRHVALWFGALGAVLAVVFLAQPFWLILVAPLLAMPHVRRNGWRGLMVASLVALSLGAIALTIGHGQTTGYWHPPAFTGLDPLAALLLLPGRMWTHFTGAYYLNDPYVGGLLLTRFCAALWSSVLAGSIVLRVVRARSGDDDLAARLAMAGVLGVSALTLLLSAYWFGFRYLLPVSGGLAIVLASDLRYLTRHRGPARTATVLLVAAVLVTGAGSMFELRRIPFTRVVAVRSIPEPEVERLLIDDLLNAGIHHVYVQDALLQWRLVFATDERIIARNLDAADRYPAYPRAVDAALRAGAPVAIVDKVSRVPHSDLRAFLRQIGQEEVVFRVVAGRFLVLYNVNEPLVRAMGYELGA